MADAPRERTVLDVLRLTPHLAPLEAQVETCERLLINAAKDYPFDENRVMEVANDLRKAEDARCREIKKLVQENTLPKLTAFEKRVCGGADDNIR